MSRPKGSHLSNFAKTGLCWRILAVWSVLASLRIELSLSEGPRSYSGYSVVRGLSLSPSQLTRLRSLVMEEERKYGSEEAAFKFLVSPRDGKNGTLDILLSPEGKEDFLSRLREWQIESETLIGDVGEHILNTRRKISNTFLRAHTQSSNKFYDQYQRYGAIEAKLRQLERLDRRVSVKTIGTTSERRKIHMAMVSSDFSAKKPIVLIDGGHHAREWVSQSTSMYLLESLVGGADFPRMSPSLCKSEQCRRLVDAQNCANSSLNLDRFDFWIIPVVNPDGYEYSHTSDRMWRKTRSGFLCKGTDPNRNYPFHWREAGASSVACSDTYAGPRPASEPEIQAVMGVMDANKDRIALYVSFHAFSQIVLSPFGYARVYPDNYKELERVASAWLESVPKLRGTTYDFGTSAVSMYPAAGGSDDYALSIGIPYSFTIELPDRGRFNFLMPPEEIVPIGHESLIGLSAMVNSLRL